MTGESMAVKIGRLSLEMSLILSLGLIDMAFLSPMLDGEVGGIGLITSIVVLLIVLFGSVANSAMSMYGKLEGQGKTTEAHQLNLTIGLLFLVSGFLIFNVFFFFSPEVVRLLMIPESQAASATLYAQIVGPSAALSALRTFGANVALVKGRTSIALRSAAVLFSSNLALNGFLGSGFHLVPSLELGVTGIAWATVTSRILACLTIFYGLWTEKLIDLNHKVGMIRILRNLKRVLRLSVVSLFEPVCYHGIQIALGTVIARSVSSDLNARSFVIAIVSIASTISFSAARVVQSEVALRLACESDHATSLKEATRKAQIIGVFLVSIALAVIYGTLLLFSDELGLTKDVSSVLRDTALVVVVLEISKCILATESAGLRAMGDVDFLGAISVFGMLFISGALGFVLATTAPFSLGFAGILVAQALDEGLRYVAVRIRRTKVLRDARAFGRIYDRV